MYHFPTNVVGEQYNMQHLHVTTRAAMSLVNTLASLQQPRM